MRAHVLFTFLLGSPPSMLIRDNCFSLLAALLGARVVAVTKQVHSLV